MDRVIKLLAFLALLAAGMTGCSKEGPTAPAEAGIDGPEDGQGSGGAALRYGSVVGEYKGIQAYANVADHSTKGTVYGTYGWRYQCVEYINRFYVVALGWTGFTCGTGNMKGCGNAKDYFTAALGLARFSNNGDVPPAPDDIIVATSSVNGHVAIVRSVDADGVHVIQQNWSNNTDDNDDVLTLTYTNGQYRVGGFSPQYPVLGWLRLPRRPARLVFRTQPGTATEGAALSVQPVVEIQDASGSRVTDATGVVTIAIASNSAGGTLGGNRTVSAVNGVATFSGLSISRAGSGYTLSATASGVGAATSSPFSVTALQSRSLSVLGNGTGSGTVTSNPSGITCTVSNAALGGTCAANYSDNTTVTLTANPTNGHTFNGWSGPCGGTGTCTVTMSQSQTVTATFTAPIQSNQLSLSGSGTGSGSVSSNPSGINCTISAGGTSGSCSASFTTTTSVTLTATPTNGHTFGGWSGVCGGTGTCTVTMSQAQNVTASFTAPVQTNQLTVSASGTGGGSVSSNPGGINCTISSGNGSGSCSASFTTTTSVTLTATPTNGHTFSGWSGACTGTGTCAVTMSQARSVTASFTAPAQSNQLTVSGSGTGGGSVTSNPSGVNCTISAGGTSGTCSASFMSTTSVTLTATPTNGHTFNGWSGACTGTGTCTVTMSQARSVTASFTAPVQSNQLTVSGSGTGSGSVSSNPSGINCTVSGGGTSGTCSASYTSTTSVTLTASATNGHTFNGWSGACSGTGACTVTMSQARNATASFTAPVQSNQLTVSGSGTGSGSVSSNPSGIGCTISSGNASGNCSASFTSTTSVTLTATPTNGHTFNGWSGACGGTGTCTVTMSQARNVTASFTAPAGPTELITNGGFESGSSGWSLSGTAYATTSLGNPHSGSGYAYFGADASGTPVNNANGTLSRNVAIPASATTATLRFWVSITTQEVTTTNAFDFLNVTIQTTGGSFLSSVTLQSNLNASGYRQIVTDLSQFRGQTIRINFLGTSDSSLPTVFRIDTVSLIVQ